MNDRRNFIKTAALAAMATTTWSSKASAEKQQSSPLGLKDLLKDGPLIGVALRNANLEPQKAALLKRDFNSITPENCMKWPQIFRNGKYNFETADGLVELAERNNMTTIGHVLVFNRDKNYPEWIFQDGSGAASKELIWKRVRQHMETMMGRYSGKVKAWDVLNEFIEVHDPGYRETMLTKHLGKDYPVKLFKIAEEIDPKAQLIYNDYGIEDPKRREHILRFVKQLQDGGARVDVIGSQSHLELKSRVDENIDETIVEFAKLGVKCAFTELDVDVIDRKGFWNSQTREAVKKSDSYKDGCPAEVLEAQAAVYKKFFESVMRNKKNVDRVTLWGLTDGDSWLNNWPWKRTNHGLLFDRDYKEKLAYKAIMEVLKKS